MWLNAASTCCTFQLSSLIDLTEILHKNCILRTKMAFLISQKPVTMEANQRSSFIPPHPVFIPVEFSSKAKLNTSSNWSEQNPNHCSTNRNGLLPKTKLLIWAMIPVCMFVNIYASMSVYVQTVRGIASTWVFAWMCASIPAPICALGNASVCARVCSMSRQS